MTSHGVNDHENLVRLNRSFDAFGLLHHVFIDVQATCRVDDADIFQVVDGIVNALLGDLDWILAIGAIYAYADFATQRFELVSCCRTVNVAGDKQGIMPIALQQICELCSRSSLTRTLKADEHDDIRLLVRGKIELGIGFAEQNRELFENDLDDVLRRRKGFKHVSLHAALGAMSYKRLDNLEAHVSLEKRHADTTHRSTDIAFGQAAFAAEVVEYFL